MSGYDMIAAEPLISSNFHLELDGTDIGALQEVNGLDHEVDVVEFKAVGKNGIQLAEKTMGQSKKVSELTMKRVATRDNSSDDIWKWFQKIQKEGVGDASRKKNRKNGSVVVYGHVMDEIARWNFENAFVSKISTSGLSATTNDPVTETITLQCENLTRKK
ncbi:MAG TPA: phage tail protein [Acidimicrobiales bacterium]|jgi:phage tail-like protein